jgi:HSP20 family protein
MANIVKKENQAVRDPFEMMREMMRWDPFREMAPFAQLDMQWQPHFDVRETKESFIFKADLPGVKKEDIKVELTGNRLQISGRREEEKEAKEDTYYTYERNYGSFSRMFTLPEGVDVEHIKTDLADGVLSLVIPKRVEAQARQIPINIGKKS